MITTNLGNEQVSLWLYLIEWCNFVVPLVDVVPALLLPWLAWGFTILVLGGTFGDIRWGLGSFNWGIGSSKLNLNFTRMRLQLPSIPSNLSTTLGS